MFESHNPKCANPACSALFHWKAGGKFFCFRPEEMAHGNGTPPEHPANAHGVIHFWLCERCAQIYTLAFDEALGVAVRPLQLALAAVEKLKELTAA